MIELLLALAITAMLLTATVVAVAASFRAYADASEQASTQAASRMVVNRLLTLIRTSTAHGPLNADATCTPPATLVGNTVTSPYIELLDPTGTLVRVDYHADTKQLWVTTTPAVGTPMSQPILGGVTACQFTLLRTKNLDNLWVLQRGTMDLTVQPDTDATLALENGHPTPIRVIASTMPRKLEHP